MIKESELLDNYIQMCKQITANELCSDVERAEYSQLYKWLYDYNKSLEQAKELKYGITEYSLHLDNIIVKSENEKIMKEITKYYKKENRHDCITFTSFKDEGNICGGSIQIIKESKKDSSKIEKVISSTIKKKSKEIDVNEVKQKILEKYNIDKTITWI